MDNTKADEKAKELVEKFYNQIMDDCDYPPEHAKQCALISNQREIELINRLLAAGLHNDFDLLRERGELMEVKQSITNQ